MQAAPRKHPEAQIVNCHMNRPEHGTFVVPRPKLTTIDFDQFPNPSQQGKPILQVDLLRRLRAWFRVNYHTCIFGYKEPYIIVWINGEVPPVSERPITVSGWWIIWRTLDQCRPTIQFSWACYERKRHNNSLNLIMWQNLDLNSDSFPSHPTLEAIMMQYFDNALAISYINKEVVVEVPKMPEDDWRDFLSVAPFEFYPVSDVKLRYSNGPVCGRAGVLPFPLIAPTLTMPTGEMVPYIESQIRDCETPRLMSCTYDPFHSGEWYFVDGSTAGIVLLLAGVRSVRKVNTAPTELTPPDEERQEKQKETRIKFARQMVLYRAAGDADDLEASLGAPVVRAAMTRTFNARDPAFIVNSNSEPTLSQLDVDKAGFGPGCPKSVKVDKLTPLRREFSYETTGEVLGCLLSSGISDSASDEDNILCLVDCNYDPCDPATNENPIGGSAIEQITAELAGHGSRMRASG